MLSSATATCGSVNSLNVNATVSSNSISVLGRVNSGVNCGGQLPDNGMLMVLKPLLLVITSVAEASVSDSTGLYVTVTVVLTSFWLDEAEEPDVIANKPSSLPCKEAVTEPA